MPQCVTECDFVPPGSPVLCGIRLGQLGDLLKSSLFKGPLPGLYTRSLLEVAFDSFFLVVVIGESTRTTILQRGSENNGVLISKNPSTATPSGGPGT